MNTYISIFSPGWNSFFHPSIILLDGGFIFRVCSSSIFLVIFTISNAWAGVPATPVLTLYQFNGPLEIPYYNADTFQDTRTSAPAGYLAQGSSVIPCVVVRSSQPLTDKDGTPFVGFRIVIDASEASINSAEKLRTSFQERHSMSVANHHCQSSVKYVIDVRKLHPQGKVPFFDPSVSIETKRGGGYTPQGNLDRIVREFHNSPYCASSNRNLTKRRLALEKSWGQFIRENKGRWSARELEYAQHLDYSMRTAIFEGHLNRGCNAYGGCERNIIALTIRNRAKENCLKSRGCSERGDYKSVATKISQYNIWDEYLTQISGITSCFLRDDLDNSSNGEYYALLRSMYEQSVPDIQIILFGEDADLQKIFFKASLKDLKELRHYYHPPAMGKCFPNYDGVEYITGAIARKGSEYILFANHWIQIDQKVDNGYFFRDFILELTDERDNVQLLNQYNGFVIDGRKVSSKTPSRCVPYGIPSGCVFTEVGRYRRLPPWHSSGKYLEIMCQIRDKAENCQSSVNLKSVKVGSTCDTQMRLMTGVK